MHRQMFTPVLFFILYVHSAFSDNAQVYTHLKHAETYYKGIGKERDELSCVAPSLYCDRFVEFMAEHTD